MTFYQLNFAGGGADVVCAGCLPDAKAEAAKNVGSLVSTAKVSSVGASCQYCGIEGS